jgi:SNF2 family DNA or RNA helicase
MPELIYHDILVELPPAARKTYREVELSFLTQIQDETIVAANAAVAGGKCRQIANGGLYSEVLGEGTGRREFHVIHDAKIDALRDLLEELQGQPLLILYEFNHDRDCIQKAFPGMPDLGSVSLKKSVELIDSFNKGLIPALLGHPAGMGHGLNMQEICSRVCFYGLTWNFEHYDQAMRRVWRQGQKSQHVIIYRIVATDTLDEVVIETLKSKDKTQSGFVGRLRTFKRN